MGNLGLEVGIEIGDFCWKSSFLVACRIMALCLKQCPPKEEDAATSDDPV